MCEKMAISVLKIVERDLLLTLQMRAEADFNRHQFLSINKQYIKLKLIQNETNRCSILW